MKSKYNFIQVYTIWVNGRRMDDVDQHFPVETNVERIWHSDFKKASDDFFNAMAIEEDGDDLGLVFQDYIVTLFCIDIDVNKFQEDFGIDFDLEGDAVQDAIPYYCDYDFTTVAERVCEFNTLTQ